jgi:hypothetical protein
LLIQEKQKSEIEKETLPKIGSIFNKNTTVQEADASVIQPRALASRIFVGAIYVPTRIHQSTLRVRSTFKFLLQDHVPRQGGPSGAQFRNIIWSMFDDI